jgi:hypothetical protein
MKVENVSPSQIYVIYLNKFRIKYLFLSFLSSKFFVLFTFSELPSNGSHLDYAKYLLRSWDQVYMSQTSQGRLRQKGSHCPFFAKSAKKRNKYNIYHIGPFLVKRGDGCLLSNLPLGCLRCMYLIPGPMWVFT